MTYEGDQEHWYGPGDHSECHDCGYCKLCGHPKKGKGCPLHPLDMVPEEK